MLDRVVTALLTKKKKPAKNILKNSIIDNEPGLFENGVSFLTNYLLTVFFSECCYGFSFAIFIMNFKQVSHFAQVSK